VATLTSIPTPRRGRADLAGWRAWLGPVGIAAGLLLGALLLFATYAKIINPVYFVEWVAQKKLDFLLPATFLAPVSLAVEGALGLALMLGIRRAWNLWPTGLLIALFLVLTGVEYVSYVTGNDKPAASCGCFGHLLDRDPVQALWQDLLVLVPLFTLCVLGREKGGPLFPRARTSAVLVGFIGLLVLFHAAPALPLDDLATHLKPDVEVADLCVGQSSDRLCVRSLLPELDDGEHVVVLTSLENEDFLEALAGLNELALTTPVWALSAAKTEAIQAFALVNALTFEVREAPLELIRPLYRRLPRSFYVRDKMVTETFDGLPPLPTPAEPTPLPGP
jgi:hypothetical protein